MTQALPEDVCDDAERARLDYDLNLRERCPNFGDQLAAWTSAAAKFQAEWEPRSYLDLRYGEAELETVDLFLPAQADAPLCIFFHPGGWQRLDKSVFLFLARPLVARGIAVLFANYPLAPRVRLGEIVASCRKCLEWIRGLGKEFGLDTSRIALFGHSAGGHLVTQIYARPQLLSEPARGAVRGVVSIGGFYDLEVVRKSFMNDALQLTRQEVEDLSPIASSSFLDCPLLLAVGGRETAEFISQQNRMAARMASEDRNVEAILLPGRDHFSLVEALLGSGNPVMSWIGQILKPEAEA